MTRPVLRPVLHPIPRPVTCLVLVALLLGLAGCSVPSRSATITVTAELSDSAGLFVGNDVGVLGVTVGKVEDIVPQGDHVLVRMKIDADQPVPANAGAVVVARSVATDRYVELTPVFREGPRLADGAVIEQPRTRTPVDFDEVLGALNTFATGIAGSAESRGAIANLLKSGSQALDGKGVDFNRAVTSLGRAVNAISGQRENIVGTVKSLDTLTGTIASNQKLVRTFIDQISDASQLLADERNNFSAALRSLSRAVTAVADFAHQNRQQLVTALDRSGDLMTSVLSRRGPLTEVLRVMGLALQNMRATLKEGRLVVRVDPTLITPLGGILTSLCQSAPVNICSAIGPSLFNLNNLLNLLGASR